MLFISFLLSTQSMAQVKLNANSNLGIGIGATTAPNPAYKLHIMDYVTMGPFNNQTFARGLLFSRINNPTSLDGIDWGIDSDCGGINFWRPWSVANFGNCKFIIKDNGNVGINLSNPAYALDVNGSVQAFSFLTTSDSNLKENIRPFASILDKLMELRPVVYNYKPIYNDQSGSSKEEFKDLKIMVEDKRLYRNTSGFLAQDVQKIFPDIVEQNDNGNLSIYTFDFVPIIVKSMQELNDKIDGKLGVNSAERTTNSIENSYLLPTQAQLASNNTIIKYQLPQKFETAQMLISSYDGRQLLQFDLAANSSQLSIESKQLYAGLFYATLLIDHKEIETQKLILTSK